MSILTAPCLLALAAPGVATAIPTPDPILGTWRVSRTGTDTAPTVYGAIRVTGGPGAFVGTTTERTFLMGDAACALAAGRQVWLPGEAHFILWDPPANPASHDYRNVTEIALYGPRSPSLAATCKGARAVAAARPTLTVRPSTTSPGGVVTFSGAHWGANVVVELLIGPPRSEATRFARARTDSTGRFRRSVRLASAAHPGRYVVLACRRSCRVKASASLTVAGC